MKYKTLFLLVSMAFFLSACASNITVTPKYQASKKANTPLASVSTVKVKLQNFEDVREQQAESILVGRREAAFGVPMGDVFSERPTFEIVRDAVKTELISNGHRIVSNKEDISIKGKIRKFWVRTDVTALYWDLVGEVSIVLEISSPAHRSPVLLGPYSGKNIERTYINPSKEIATRVLVKSLESAMHAMSSDRKLTRVIRAKR